MRERTFKYPAIWLVAMLGGLPIVGLHAQPAEVSAKSDLEEAVSTENAETAASLHSLVRDEVVKRLNEIKPQDTEDHAYKVVVAEPIKELPGNLRLDLVYKIGHYRWALVALRFERHAGQPEVAVSEVVYGSAFPFIKEFLQSVEESKTNENGGARAEERDSRAKYRDHRDFYRVRRATIPTAVFDRLLLRGHTLWRSSISKVYVGPPRDPFDLGGDSGSGRLLSSGDGLILFRLSENRENGRALLRDDGTLIAGDLAPRIPGGGASNYRFIRTHLFWEAFHEYLVEHPLSDDVPSEEAVPLLVARLKEPRLVEGYRDFFRRSLYVKALGEMGLAEAIPALREAAHSPGLDKRWSESLRRDIAQAIARIEALSASNPKE